MYLFLGSQWFSFVKLKNIFIHNITEYQYNCKTVRATVFFVKTLSKTNINAFLAQKIVEHFKCPAEASQPFVIIELKRGSRSVYLIAKVCFHFLISFPVLWGKWFPAVLQLIITIRSWESQPSKQLHQSLRKCFRSKGQGTERFFKKIEN